MEVLPTGERPMNTIRIRRAFARADGQGLAEYALILASIAIACIVAVTFFGTQLQEILSTIGSEVANTI
jgi:Flp pilus assembly pilin Flp